MFSLKLRQSFAGFLAVISVALFSYPSEALNPINFNQALTQAIESDLDKYTPAEYEQLQGLFGLANGTRRMYLGGKLEARDQIEFSEAREKALTLIQEKPAKFPEKLAEFFSGATATRGGRAYLADLVPSIEMNAPNILNETSPILWLQRNEFAYTSDEVFSTMALQNNDIRAADQAVEMRSKLAKKDPTRGPSSCPHPMEPRTMTATWSTTKAMTYTFSFNTIPFQMTGTICIGATSLSIKKDTLRRYPSPLNPAQKKAIFTIFQVQSSKAKSRIQQIGIGKSHRHSSRHPVPVKTDTSVS
jgi:hypothetical protein